MVAQWSTAERALFAKLVYYGPAFGGKTTNLESLHRITDPDGANDLVAVKTSDDRTLFFDLLPLDLGNILGYQVAMKLYTVPGQVQYDATRRVVLAGADAVVFVADSSPGRERDNRESLENLRVNMKANGLDPATVPVLVQFNKQDVADAAPPDGMRTILGLDPSVGRPAVAIRGEGVLETFTAACRAMLERLAALAPERTRREIDVEELRAQIEQACRRYEARAAAAADIPALPGVERSDAGLIVDGGDLLEKSVRTTVQLGESLSDERGRARRLENEARALRRLSETLKRTAKRFDHDGVLDETLEVASEVVGAAAVSVLARGEDGALRTERVLGRDVDPLMDHDDGMRLLDRMVSAYGPTVVDDVPGELGADVIPGIRSVASVPVDHGRSRFLVAHAPLPDGRFLEDDVRFLATVAAHLAVGIERVSLHAALRANRDHLVQAVEARTADLRSAYDELREGERVKDRFLSGVSHEMRTPLTTAIGAATFLRDYEGDAGSRREMAQAVLTACDAIGARLDDLFRLVQMESDAVAIEPEAASPRSLVAEAIRLAGSPVVTVRSTPEVAAIRVDASRMIRAVANLVDNAVKFSPEGAVVEVAVEETADGVAIRVLDRGPGIPVEDDDRIYVPFEQGVDARAGKPAGVGLGLHEARVIAARHDGSLEHVAREGGGTEFRLLIPRRAERSQPRMEATGA